MDLSIWGNLPLDLVDYALQDNIEYRICVKRARKIPAEVMQSFEALYATIPKLRCDPYHGWFDYATWVILPISGSTTRMYLLREDVWGTEFEYLGDQDDPAGAVAILREWEGSDSLADGIKARREKNFPWAWNQGLDIRKIYHSVSAEMCQSLYDF